jgi:hypothetical protein
LRTKQDNDSYAAVDADIDSSMAKKPKSSKKGDQPTDLRDVPDAEEDPGHSAYLKLSVPSSNNSHAFSVYFQWL